MKSNLKRNVVSGFLWSMIHNWGIRIISLALMMYLARVLSPTDFGIYAAATIVMAFVKIVADQGLSEAIVQQKEISEQQVNSAFLVNLGISILMSLLLWVFGDALSFRINSPDSADIIQVCGLGLILNSFGFSQTAMSRRAFHYRWLATCAVCGNLASVVLTVIAAYLGAGVWALVVHSLASSIITVALLWTRPSWTPRLSFDFRGAFPLIRYGSMRFGASFLDFINTKYVDYCIVTSIGAIGLGYFTVGSKLYLVFVSSLGGVILQIALNAFSRLAGDIDALRSAYLRFITLAAAAVSPFFILIAALSGDIMGLIFGEKWAPSAHTQMMLALLGAVQVVQYYNGTLLNAVGRPEIGLYSQIFVKIPLTVGALWLARDGDLDELVTAYALAQMATVPFGFVMVRRLVGVGYRQIAASVVPFFLSGALVFVVVRQAHAPMVAMVDSVLLRTLALAITGGLLYLVLLSVFFRASLGKVIREARGIWAMRKSRKQVRDTLE